MKIFDENVNPFNAVDAVVEHGIAVLTGTKTDAESYSNKVIKCLEPYKEIEPILGYQNVPLNGYFYYIYDANRFSSEDEYLEDYILKADQLTY